MKKKKVFIHCLSLLLAASYLTSSFGMNVYAEPTESTTEEESEDGEFAGWDDENKQNAWDVYQNTDWSSLADKLVILVDNPYAQDSVAAKDISNNVAQYRSTIETVLSSNANSYGYMDNAKWTELMLAALQVISNGTVDSVDPYQVVKYNIGDCVDKGTTSVTAEQSISIFYEAFMQSLVAHQNAGGGFDFYKNDDELQSVLQGTLLGATYSSTNLHYTKENAKAYYDAYPGSFANKGIPSFHGFATKVSKHYKVVQFSTNGATSSSAIDPDTLKIVDNLKTTQSRKSMVKRALSLVGKAYSYGGSWNGEDPYTPTDCSGFCGGLWKHAGIYPGRSTDAIWAYAKENHLDYYDFKDAKPGDLVMYEGHVAMLTGNGKQIVHASNKVDGIKVSSTYAYRKTLGFVRFPAKDDAKNK